MKKLLLIISTHGNEPLGCEIVKKLEDKKLDRYFDVLIANPEALRQEVRFIDRDLNRSYPGKKNSPISEFRLAYDNLLIARKYKYVIDIHEANQGKDDFIIVPRKNIGSDSPVEFIGLKRILLWPNPKGPLGSVLTNTIELEFGAKNRNRRRMISQGSNIIERFIKRSEGRIKIKKQKQEVYQVMKVLTIAEWEDSKIALKDFNETNIKQERFLPLLVDQYLTEGIKCYKMKKIK